MVSSSSNIEWRRSKVLELASHGLNQSEISRTLQISQPTINRDSTYLRKQAKLNIRKYIDEKLPHECEKCLVGLNSIVREAWITSQQTQDRREKIQALSLAKDCYAMKLELLTNATMLDDAIRFVAQHQQHNQQLNQNSNVKATTNRANLSSTNSKTDTTTTASFLDSAGTDKEEGDDDTGDIQRHQEDTESLPTSSRGDTTTNSVF